MTLNFNQMLTQIKSMDRILLVAILLSAAALFYAGNLGIEWWGNYGRAVELRAQTQQLRTALSNIIGDDPGATRTVAERATELATEANRFTFETDDGVIRLLDDLSRAARVRVASASARDAAPRVEHPLTYRVLTVEARIEGSVSRLFDFIDQLSIEAPGMRVLTARMGGFGVAPWLVLELEFLLNPTPAAIAKCAS